MTKPERKNFIKNYIGRMNTLGAQYGAEANNIPAHVQKRLDNIMNADHTVSLANLSHLGQKALEVYEVWVLAEWGRGNVMGRLTPLVLEAKAKNCESLARMLEKQGHEEASAKQLVKAADWRKKALELARASSEEN